MTEPLNQSETIRYFDTIKEYHGKCETLKYREEMKASRKRKRGDKYYCPYGHSDSCWKFCDPLKESGHMCGQCVHFRIHGSCFHGHDTRASQPTWCPHFDDSSKPDGKDFDLYIDHKVWEECGKWDSSPECRAARMKYRDEWRKKFK